MACKYRDKYLHDNILAKKNATNLGRWYFSYIFIRENKLYTYYISNGNLLREMG